MVRAEKGNQLMALKKVHISSKRRIQKLSIIVCLPGVMKEVKHKHGVSEARNLRMTGAILEKIEEFTNLYIRIYQLEMPSRLINLK